VNVSSTITDVPAQNRKAPVATPPKLAAAPHVPVVVTQIAANGDVTCARLADATVRCWGDNSFNVISPTDSAPMENHLFPSPVAIADLPRVAQIVIVEASACVRLEDGTVRCWGTDDGTLGLGSALPPGPPPSTEKPMPVLKLQGVAVLSGHSHLCALLSDASVTCWHDYDSGNGDPRDKGSRAPVVVPGFANAAQIADGGNISCALLASGKVRCWRDVSPGLIPRGKVRPDAYDVVGLEKNVDALFVGDAGGCAITKTQEIRCFGGVPFDGPSNTSPRVSYPMKIAKGITAMALGNDLACMIVAGGDVLCDKADYSNPHHPTKVEGVTGAVEIVVGSDHACARNAAGVVSCWGRNDKGQLGDGTKTDRTTASPVVF
jgi:alpha-tubulin suppressor-like RCC1 family protein